jgi:hypothetical protein
MIILDNPSSYTVGNTVDIKKRWFFWVII